jgi:hypothetical protein
MSRNTRIIPNPDAALKSAMSKAFAAELTRLEKQSPYGLFAAAAANAVEAITMGISGQGLKHIFKNGCYVYWSDGDLHQETTLGNFFF